MFRSIRGLSWAAGSAGALVLAACASSTPPAGEASPAPAPPASEAAPIQAGRAPAAGEYAQAPDVERYDIEIALPPRGGAIAARATLLLRPTGTGGEVSLDLTGLAVTRVLSNGAPVPFRLEGGKLVVQLGGDGQGARRMQVDYRGTPDDGLIQQNNVHGEPTVFADNWPNRARFWFPSVDDPSDRASVRFTVHAPSAWSVIANGVLAGDPVPTPAARLAELGFAAPADHRTWVWESDVEIPAYTMVIGAGPLVARSVGTAACGRAPASRRPDRCVEVGTWVFPQDTAKVGPSFRRAPAMVDFFSELIGPFPYEKLMNVQSSTRFGGMENASAIFYSEEALARGANIEGTVSHEIAHQWFGDSATEAEWSHLWLSEGFATYFGHLFFEHADGVDAFRARMEESRQSYVGSPVVGQPILSGSPDLFALLNANNYPKGGWVLHMLRGVLGDDVFFRGIRSYYARFSGGTARSEDLQEVMEAAGGQSLAWFFDQWLGRPGYPILQVEWRYEAAANEVAYRIEQVQNQSWPAFVMPMDLVASTPAGEVRHTLRLEGRVQEGRFRVQGTPTDLAVDPEGWILKEVRVTAR